MRQAAVALYILGTLVLVWALFAAAPNMVLVGATPVLAASIINMVLRRRQPEPYTTTDWLKGRRRRRNPLRSGLTLLALLIACLNLLLFNSPYSGARRYSIAAFLLVYVAIIGAGLFDKLETPLFPKRPAGENTAPR